MKKIKYIFPSSKKQLRRKLGRDYQFIIESTPFKATPLFPEPVKPQLVYHYPGSEPHYLTVFPIGLYSWFKNILTVWWWNTSVSYESDSTTEKKLKKEYLSVRPVEHFTNYSTYSIIKSVSPHAYYKKVYMGGERFYTSEFDDRFIPPNLIDSWSYAYYKRCEYYRVEFVLDDKEYNLLYEDKDYKYYYKTIYITFHYKEDVTKIERSDKLKGCIYYRERK